MMTLPQLTSEPGRKLYAQRKITVERSARWAESHDEQLRAIISAAARVLQGHIGETREVTVPAASALDLERQLASATAG